MSNSPEDKGRENTLLSAGLLKGNRFTFLVWLANKTHFQGVSAKMNDKWRNCCICIMTAPPIASINMPRVTMCW